MSRKRTRFEDLQELADEVAALRAEVAEFRELLQEKREAEAEVASRAETTAEDTASARSAPVEEVAPEPEETPKDASTSSQSEASSEEASAEEACDEKELLAAINNPNGCMAKLERIVGARQVNKRSLLERILEAKAEQPDERFGDYGQIKEAVKGLGDRTMASLRRKWSRD